MSAIPAPNCLHEGCGNKTWYGYCQHHRDGGPAQSGSAQTGGALGAGSGAAPAAAVLAPPRYGDPRSLWADMLSVFPDARDEVNPMTVRREAIDTLIAAVDSEAFRRFASIDVADAYERTELADQMRQQVVADLTPEPSRVTAEEARELSHSSADHYGRTGEDSRYLAAYALGAEWEFRRLTEGLSTPYEQFVAACRPEMEQAIDEAFRRNLSEFTEVVRQTTGHEPACSAPFPPGLALPAQLEPEPQPEEMTEETKQEIRDWFDRNRAAQEAPAPSQDTWTHEAQQPHGEQPPAQQGGTFSKVLQFAKNVAIDYVTDPDGYWEDRRITRRLDQQAEQQEAWRREGEVLQRELDRELLKYRQKRNRGRGFFG